MSMKRPVLSDPVGPCLTLFSCRLPFPGTAFPDFSASLLSLIFFLPVPPPWLGITYLISDVKATLET